MQKIKQKDFLNVNELKIEVTSEVNIREKGILFVKATLDPAARHPDHPGLELVICSDQTSVSLPSRIHQVFIAPSMGGFLDGIVTQICNTVLEVNLHFSQFHFTLVLFFNLS